MFRKRSKPIDTFYSFCRTSNVEIWLPFVGGWGGGGWGVGGGGGGGGGGVGGWGGGWGGVGGGGGGGATLA